jgi:hypothetical protein
MAKEIYCHNTIKNSQILSSYLYLTSLSLYICYGENISPNPCVGNVAPNATVERWNLRRGV